jgi:hypothetical protein
MKVVEYLKQTKLLQLLSVISTDTNYSYAEVVDFVAYKLRRSKKKKLIKLLEYLEPYAPFTEEKLGKLRDRGIYIAIFGANTPPNERALDLLVSDLYQLVEEYLMYLHAKIQPFTPPRVFLLEFYAKKRLKRGFDDCYRATFQKLTENNMLDVRVSYELFTITQIKLDFQLLLHEEQDLDPVEVAKCFDLHLVTNQMRQAIQLINYQESFTTKATSPFLTVALEQIKQHPEWLDEPLIGIYYYAYKGLSEKTIDYHDKFMEKLLENEKQLQPSELNDLLICSANIIIYIVNSGDRSDENYRRVFNVYQKRQELGLIYQTDGSISPHEYKNIVATAIRLNELDSATLFNEQNKDKNPLYPVGSDKVYIFNKARIAFELKAYKQIFDDLLGQDFKDDILDINTEVLLLKALFELAQKDNTLYNNLEIRLSKFHARIKRNKTIALTIQTAIMQFAEVVSRLVKFNETYQTSASKKAELSKLEKFVTDNYTIQEQKWLLEKVKN